MKRTLNALTSAKPRACTGKVVRLTLRLEGKMSAQAGAILGRFDRNSGTVGVLSVSPKPKVMLPFELRKKLFQTQFAGVTGPPYVNSKPPLRGPAIAELPAPSLSSPRNGGF